MKLLVHFPERCVIVLFFGKKKVEEIRKQFTRSVEYKIRGQFL